MNHHLRELLPDGISDEAAYHLVNFVWALASALDSLYFGQVKRYMENNEPQSPPDYLSSTEEQWDDDEVPF